VLDHDLERTPFRAQRGRAQVRRDRAGIERCAHHDHRHAELLEPGEGHVAVEVALVELVHEDDANPLERRIGDEPPREDALGHEADPRLFARDILETDLVADRTPDLFPQLLGDAARGEAGSQASRLQDDDFPLEAGVEERARHARGFARAGRRLEDEAGRTPQRGDDLGKEGVDGERLQCHAIAMI
jgi:hypothetical protein